MMEQRPNMQGEQIPQQYLTLGAMNQLPLPTPPDMQQRQQINPATAGLGGQIPPQFRVGPPGAIMHSSGYQVFPSGPPGLAYSYVPSSGAPPPPMMQDMGILHKQNQVQVPWESDIAPLQGLPFPMEPPAAPSQAAVDARDSNSGEGDGSLNHEGSLETKSVQSIGETGTGAKLESEVAARKKKLSHASRERKRQAEVNAQFLALKSLLPLEDSSDGGRIAKNTILNVAQQHIRRLSEQNSLFFSQVHMLMRDLHWAQEEIRQLRNILSVTKPGVSLPTGPIMDQTTSQNYTVSADFPPNTAPNDGLNRVTEPVFGEVSAPGTIQLDGRATVQNADVYEFAESTDPPPFEAGENTSEGNNGSNEGTKRTAPREDELDHLQMLSNLAADISSKQASELPPQKKVKLESF